MKKTDISVYKARREKLKQYAYDMINGVDYNDLVKYLKLIIPFAFEMIPYETTEEMEEDIDDVKNYIAHKIVGTQEGIAAQVRDWVNNATGAFNITDVYRDLGCITQKKRTSVRVQLLKLKNNGDIEPLKRNGMYRKVERSFTIEDLTTVDRTKIDIKLPFGLELRAAVKPGNIILFQGTRNAGKTGLLINTAKLNTDGPMKVFFFSSEADVEEMADLVEQDRDYHNGWVKKVNFSSDFENYVDSIQPNDINIIDYLEIRGGQDACDMMKVMHDIHARLEKGVAIVAIQKKRGQQIGFGGEYMEAKPRIVCNIDPIDSETSKITIQKAKIKGKLAKEKGFHPEGLCMRFKTDDGINLVAVDRYWRKLSKKQEHNHGI